MSTVIAAPAEEMRKIIAAIDGQGSITLSVDSLKELLASEARVITIETPAAVIKVKAVRICAFCSAGAHGNPKPPPRLKCARCRNVMYCDEQCQKAHHATHKPTCHKGAGHASFTAE